MDDIDVKQMTLRISKKLHEESKEAADKIGCSHNSFLALMINMGMKAYNGKYIIHSQNLK